MLTEGKQKPNTRDFLERLVTKGANGVLKLATKHEDHLEQVVVYLCNAQEKNLWVVFKYWELVVEVKIQEKRKTKKHKKAVHFAISQSGQLFITQCFHGCESHHQETTAVWVIQQKSQCNSFLATVCTIKHIEDTHACRPEPHQNCQPCPWSSKALN